MTNPKRNFSEQVQTRLKAARKRRRQEAAAQAVVGIALTILGIALIASLIILSGSITLLAWNYGVVSIVAACGGAVSKIGLGAAICANLAMGIIGRIFRRPTPTKVTNKA